jgi:hypothetical protein
MFNQDVNSCHAVKFGLEKASLTMGPILSVKCVLNLNMRDAKNSIKLMSSDVHQSRHPKE